MAARAPEPNKESRDTLGAATGGGATATGFGSDTDVEVWAGGALIFTARSAIWFLTSTNCSCGRFCVCKIVCRSINALNLVCIMGSCGVCASWALKAAVSLRISSFNASMLIPRCAKPYPPI